jgi:C4-dicarboxylate-specific signal transduction histidine kinase
MPSATRWMSPVDLPRRGALLLLTRLESLSRLQRAAVLCVTGSATLALVAVACSRLGLDFAVAAFALLMVVVGLSLLDGLIASAVLSVVAVGCLCFLLVEPRHTFVVGDAPGLTALTAFLLASLAASGLASRLGGLQRERARLLEANAALERSARHYRAIFEHMPIGLCQVDARDVMPLLKELRAQGVTDLKAYNDEHPEFIRRTQNLMIVEEANEELARICGAKSAAEMMGPATHFWKPDLFDGPRRLLESRYRGEMVFRELIKLRTLDGRVIDVLFSVARTGPVLDRSLVGVIDVTDRIRAQEMLNRLQADFAHAARVSMLGELTASIAHEVNQPLAAIATNGEAGLRWLARPEPDLMEVRELMREVVADARRAADVIGRVRALATRQLPERALLSLDEVIREALLFLRHEIQSRNVTVSHHAAPEAPAIVGDRTQLQQVIVNLAVNAMQAMASADCSGRRISIHTAMPDAAMLCCRVEDTGPGLPPEHVDRLFEGFFTTKDGGMGMGLPISRSIIEAHGGTITAETRAAGRGACFSFTLPVAG